MTDEYLPKFLSYPNPSIYLDGYSSYVVVDFEATSVHATDPKSDLVLACWKIVNSDGTEIKKSKRAGELDQSELVDDIEAADFIVAHNAKYELQWLQRCGLDLRTVLVYCTMIGHWVKAGNRRWKKDLNSVALYYGIRTKDDLVSNLIKQGVPVKDIPASKLLYYCGEDVDITHEVFKKQRYDLYTSGLLPVQYTRCITIPALAAIEFKGLYLDKDRVLEEYNTTKEEHDKVSLELATITGGINTNSPIQMAEFLYETIGFSEVTDRRGKPLRNKPSKAFPDGQPKTDVATLSKLVPETDEQERFLELVNKESKLSSALSKNLEFFKGVVDEKGSLLYAEINQGRTATHRLASSGIKTKFEQFDKDKGAQFQNIPRSLKSLFTARKDGWLVGEADGSQLEFRVAGHLGNEDVIREEIRNKVDIHKFTRDTLIAAGDEELCSIDDPYEQRQQSKKYTFRPLYGGSQGSPAVQAYCEAWVEKYSNLYATQTSWTHEVLNTGKLVTEWGMVYHWPDTRMYRSGYISNTTSIFNYPIQAFATAEIIPIGLTYFWHRIKDADMFLVNTVHDSIIAELPEKEIELFREIAVQALTHDVYSYLEEVYNVEFSVPLGVGMKVASHWSEPGVEEISIDVERRK